MDLANDFSFVSITGYSDLESENFVDATFTAAPLLGAEFFDDLQQISQEFRLLSPANDRFNYVVGLYYLDREVDITRITDWNLGPFVGRNTRTFVEDSQLYSVYGQFNYRFSDAFSISSSLRYTDEEKDGDLVRSIAGIVPPTQLATPVSDSFSDD